MPKKITDREISITEVEILFQLENGKRLKVEMNLETQRLMLGLLHNFFSKDIPYVDEGPVLEPLNKKS